MLSSVSALIRPIDREFGKWCESKGAQELVVFAASLCSFALSKGNICIDLRFLSSDDLWDESTVDFPENRNEWISSVASWKFTSVDGNNSLLTLRGSQLYLTRYYLYEQRIVNRLNYSTIAKPNVVLSNDSKELLQKLFNTKEDFSNFEGDLQLAGTLLPLFSNFAIISGGPGTGKTTTVAKLLSLLISEEADIKIELATPTGKAAQRMNESIKGALRDLPLPDFIVERLSLLKAQTIHRLLGSKHNSPQFRHNSENVLDLDCIVIDEASMVDIPLMAKLFDALPEQCKVILLGDQFQLASVEAGAALGDLCEALTYNHFSADFVEFHKFFTNETNILTESTHFSPVVQLKKSFRFDPYGGVGKVSRLINDGDISIVLELSGSKDDVVLVNSLSNSAIDSYSQGIRTAPTADIALNRLNEGIILTTRNEGVWGRIEINNSIIERYKKRGSPYLSNMPIMISENSYSLSLFNGDMGIVRKENGEWLGCFLDENGEIRRIPVVLLPSWEPAFAITIHKSQGSEYSRVAVMLGDRDSTLLTRELVYTAITRAKPVKGAESGCVIIQGEPELLAKAISRRVTRSSGIFRELSV